MTDQISARLLDQRVRNRMIEVLEMLTEPKDTLSSLGAGEYFNSFFDWFPDRPPLHSNSTFVEGEQDALTKVLALMDRAANAMPQHVTEAELIASEWPQRIAPEAQAALALMRSRGRFSEEDEEELPSGRWEN